MKTKIKNRNLISRRGILPILGLSFLAPIIGFGKPIDEQLTLSESEEEYQTLLKPDGTAVKVKVSSIKKSKIIEKNISNTSFLSWLGRKL
ncbi:MAG: hypothetical protein COC22_04445 [Flavobacteriaceae bacterium]|nr:MAG: hypothetical protein COC22_04445 [Flavobacteriaceae bacterium]